MLTGNNVHSPTIRCLLNVNGLFYNNLLPIYGNMAVKMAVVTNLVAVKGLQVAVNFGEGGSEGLPRSGNSAV